MMFDWILRRQNKIFLKMKIMQQNFKCKSKWLNGQHPQKFPNNCETFLHKQQNLFQDFFYFFRFMFNDYTQIKS